MIEVKRKAKDFKPVTVKLNTKKDLYHLYRACLYYNAGSYDKHCKNDVAIQRLKNLLGELYYG